MLSLASCTTLMKLDANDERLDTEMHSIITAKGAPVKLPLNPPSPYKLNATSLFAYSPGVAQPCLEIAEDKSVDHLNIQLVAIW